jgi:hypothetical protein
MKPELSFRKVGVEVPADVNVELRGITRQDVMTKLTLAVRIRQSLPFLESSRLSHRAVLTKIRINDGAIGKNKCDVHVKTLITRNQEAPERVITALLQKSSQSIPPSRVPQVGSLRNDIPQVFLVRNEWNWICKNELGFIACNWR